MNTTSYQRYEVEVTVKGRADGLVVSRFHFADQDAAEVYAGMVKAHGLYEATSTICTRPHCPDVDVTKEA